MHNYIKTFLLVVVFLCGVQGASSFKNLDECTEEEREGILKTNVYVDSKHYPVLYQAVYDLQQLFEISGISYVTLFGASLGILRNEELIPWDDNVDFGVTVDQEEKIKALIPLATKLGYSIYADDISGYKFSKIDPLFNEASGKKYNLFIDICLYRPEGENYVLARYKGRQIFSNSWLKKEELEEIEIRHCGPLELRCSKYAKDHVIRMYGEYCVDVGHFYCSHINGDLEPNGELVPTRYIWSIRNVAKYPAYKDLKLENRVEAFLGNILGGTSALELAKQREDKKAVIDEIITANKMFSADQMVNSILELGTLTSLDYSQLGDIMYGEMGKAPTLGTSALATLRAGDRFLKISRGSGEHENLIRIRTQLGLNNEATLYDCGDNTFLVIPASYYDPHKNLTLTVSHFAGENSYDVLYSILLNPIFLEVGEKKGIELGAAIARLHKRLGVPHNDIHPGNVRFTESIDKPGEAEKIFFIDIGSVVENSSGKNINKPDIIVDILSLLSMTICHRFKNNHFSTPSEIFDSLLGSKKVTETEKLFASGVIKGYFDAANHEIRLTIYKQFLEYKKNNFDISSFYCAEFLVFNSMMLDQIFEQEKAKYIAEPIKKIKYFLDS